jgi:ketosteroid isomerase-like protein
MRKANLIVLALAAIYLLAASLVSGQGGKGGNVEQTIKALTEQWRQALLKDDAAAYDKLTAEDFITIGTAGRSFTKAEIVGFLKSGTLKYDAYDYSDIKIRVYGDTALVNCTLNQKGHRGDIELIGGPYLVVLVWVKRNGQWQTVSWQGTRQLPQP